MNQPTFEKVCQLAFSDADLSHEDDSPLFGFGLSDFEPACVTLGAAARTVRWQCCYIGGGIDQEALSECRIGFGRKVQVVDVN